MRTAALVFTGSCIGVWSVGVACIVADTIHAHRRADARKEAARIAQSYLRT